MPAPRLAIRWIALVATLALAAPAVADDPAPAPAPPPGTPAPPPAPPDARPVGLDFPNDQVIERRLPSDRQKGTGPVIEDAVYFYRTNFIKSGDLAAQLSLIGIPALGVVLSPSGDNALLFQGSADAIEMALDAAAYFDIAAPQVFIEAKVIEITYESNFEFGLDYLWNRTPNGPDTLFRGADAVLSPPSAIASLLPGGLPFQGTSLLGGFVGTNAMKFGDLDLRIQAMQLEGKAEILSKPSIVATQGIESTLTTSEDTQVTVFQTANQSGNGITITGENVTYNSSNLQTGVKLAVTPMHVGESFVTLKVNPVVNGIAGLSASRGGTLQPIRTLRSASTTVTMGDGETLVIGGLYSNAHLTEKAKTPLLSEIPVLGCLFTRTRETKAKTELVFLLTPHIVRKTAELKIITPPSELERLEGTAKDADPYVPAGPHLCPPCLGPWRGPGPGGSRAPSSE